MQECMNLNLSGLLTTVLFTYKLLFERERIMSLSNLLFSKDNKIKSHTLN